MRLVQPPPFYLQGNWGMRCPWDLFVCEFLARIPTKLPFPGLLSSIKSPLCDNCNRKCSLLRLSTCTLITDWVWKRVCACVQAVSHYLWQDTQQSTLCYLWGRALLEVTKPSNSQVLQHKKEPLVWNVSRRVLVQVTAGSAEWNRVNLARRKGPYEACEAEPLGFSAWGITSTNNAQPFLISSPMTTLFDFLKETSLKNVWLFLRVIKPLT